MFFVPSSFLRLATCGRLSLGLSYRLLLSETLEHIFFFLRAILPFVPFRQGFSFQWRGGDDASVGGGNFAGPLPEPGRPRVREEISATPSA